MRDSGDRLIFSRNRPPERPAVETLPGIEKGNHEAGHGATGKAGRQVLLLDEDGGWCGCGTAWKPAEDGQSATILSHDPFIGKEPQRTTADVPLRQTLKRLGFKWLRPSRSAAAPRRAKPLMPSMRAGESDLDI